MSQERSQDRKGRLQSMKGQEGGRWCCDEGEGPVKGILSVSLWTSGDTATTHKVSNGIWTNTIKIKGPGKVTKHANKCLIRLFSHILSGILIIFIERLLSP